MTGKASRAKGHRYERQVASDFRERGWDAITTRNLRGGYQGDADVLLYDYLAYVECKNQGRINFPAWTKTVIEQAPPGWLRLLFIKIHGRRRDSGEWVCMPRKDFDEIAANGLDSWWRKRDE